VREESIRECYGFRVACAADPAAAAVVDAFFGPVPPAGFATGTPTVRLAVEVVDEAFGPAAEPPFLPADFATADPVRLDTGTSRAVVDPAGWTATVSLHRADLADQIVWGRWLLEKVFLVLFCRSARHYPLHAGAITVGGKTALVTADSGVGKSTFTAWALKRGAEFAGEDIMIRHVGDDAGRFWGYPRVAYLSDELLAGWPELDPALASPVPNRNKYRVRLPESLAGRLRPAATPAALLFLVRGGADLVAVDVDDAVERCRSDFDTGKLDPAAVAAVERDLRTQLAGVAIWELGLTADLDANHQTLLAALEKA
jgi:hypothetical protein